MIFLDGARRDDPSSSDTEERTYNRHQRKVKYKVFKSISCVVFS